MVQRKLTKPFAYLLIAFLSVFNSGFATDKPYDDGYIKDNQQLAERLHWLDNSSLLNYCSGFYQVQPLDFTHHLSAPYVLKAKNGVEIQPDHTIIYHQATLLQTDEILQANRALSFVDKNTNQINKVEAQGNVQLHRPGLLITADNGTLLLPDQHLTVDHLAYRVQSKYTLAQAIEQNGKIVYRATGYVGRGTAAEAQQVESNVFVLKKASFSFCPPQDHAWELRGNNVKIDRNKQEVILHDATFYIANTPVFYTPYFSFSYDESRKSGLLLPDVSLNRNNGLGIGIPYYWNMAPNYDMLITPILYTQRGIQLNTLFRYLTWNSLGKLYVSFLPNDHAFRDFRHSSLNNPSLNKLAGSDRLRHTGSNRLFFSWQDQTIFNPYWEASANMNYVNDDYYFQDFSPLIENNNNTIVTQLLQQATVQFHGQHWNFTSQVQNYETLHPVNTTPTTDQYARFPQLNLGTNYPDQWLGLDIGFHSEFINFRHPLFPNHVDTTLGAVGQRYDLTPHISWPKHRSCGFFIPSLKWDMTAYRLHNRKIAGTPDNIDRSVPIFSIDSGLFFDRDIKLGGGNYTQTLEPRLYYLYVPFHDQSNIPLFDTSLPLFTYDSIFRNNRFNGLDRIGDANQIGFGLTTHFIDKNTGTNKMDFSIGQIYYFHDRRVTLNGSPNANDREHLSPLTAQLTYRFNSNWSVTGNIAWNYPRGFIQNDQINLQYKPDNNRIANVGYTYQPANTINPTNNNENNINQLNTSFLWPIYHNWKAMGALNLNLNQTASHGAYVETYLLGLQYDSCCWAIRLVGSHEFNHLDNNSKPIYDTTYFIQFAFKGLTSVGLNSANDVLHTNIPGFPKDDVFY